MKLAHLSFGPKKVMDRLRALEPDNPWPADSTAADIRKRNGLVRPRRKRRRVPPDPHALVTCSAPAQSWSAHFKGDFRLASGQRCYPLTITDNHSRFILQCRALSRMTTAAVKPWFEWVFREYGLPETLRTDNSAPFASLAAGGLSQLSKWWVRLGIRPERIRPATPSDPYDYDSSPGEYVLFESNGQKLVLHVGKNGFYHVHDRKSGRPVNVYPKHQGYQLDHRVQPRNRRMGKHVVARSGSENAGVSAYRGWAQLERRCL